MQASVGNTEEVVTADVLRWRLHTVADDVKDRRHRPKSANVVFDNMIAGIEIVNCKNVKVQARKNCNTVAIDKTDGIVVYVSRECMDTVTITASKSSEMNVSFPGATDEEDNIERPIPEQYVHKIVDGKLTAEVSELYGE